jgi:hypothetical protein
MGRMIPVQDREGTRADKQAVWTDNLSTPGRSPPQNEDILDPDTCSPIRACRCTHQVAPRSPTRRTAQAAPGAGAVD